MFLSGLTPEGRVNTAQFPRYLVGAGHNRATFSIRDLLRLRFFFPDELNPLFYEDLQRGYTVACFTEYGFCHSEEKSRDSETQSLRKLKSTFRINIAI